MSAPDLSALVTQIAVRARAASLALATAPTAQKDAALRALAALIPAAQPELLAANLLDVEAARAAGLPAASLDALASGSFPRFAQPGDVTAMLRVGRQPRLN
jgi:glutamate-5-semialdehyde dehydrogenase